MTTDALIKALDYSESRRFVTPETIGTLPAGELAFAFRRVMTPSIASDSPNVGKLHGAYLLQDEPGGPAVPVVYVVETKTDTDARVVHRAVWNQNLTPFIIVVSPTSVRLYPGFDYQHDVDKTLGEVAADTSTALKMLAAFTASAIDDGTVWREWGHKADPLRRADESLLRNLKKLDEVLQEQLGMSREASHGLIGKFVYLYYLRHRDILSDSKLKGWELSPRDLFTRNATLKTFRKVNEGLQTWLNGSVFQYGDDALVEITTEQLRVVAGVFAGDSSDGQLHLDFQAYDFSQIPIETLSCVYEQFLHDSTDDAPSRGKSLGAYYTPIPLADYMIAEMEKKRPLQEGMKVLDPSCGSGVFLVQCYRRLVEKRMKAEGRKLRKRELRSLLTESIFGIDRDADACRVAELSLILTLLDYVTPPDLEDTNFKLPTLRDQNIFEDDFFRTAGPWQQKLGEAQFDWCIGNPPWSEVKGKPAPEHEHYPVWQWMKNHAADCPTSDNQIAEAFLWKAAEHLDINGVAGLLVPSMTCFKKNAVEFRKRFFSRRSVWCLANFANLAYVLFAGRAESPAAAIFYGLDPLGDDEIIQTFSPFVAEQVANRSEWSNDGKKRENSRVKKRKPTWNIVVNHADVCEVTIGSAKKGDELTWKLAMWGSARDGGLLQRLKNRCADTFQSLCDRESLMIAEGIHLVTKSEKGPLTEHADLVGRKTVSFEKLKNVGRIFSFPLHAMGQVSPEKSFIRNRGGLAGLPVSHPPHLIVDCSRRFAVYSDEFILIPKSQIGVSGSLPASNLLRALSVLLTSDYCLYHQFFMSSKMGVERQIAYPETLKKLSIPNEFRSAETRDTLAEIHIKLQALSEKHFSPLGLQAADEERFAMLLDEANTNIFRLLGLRPTERWLIEDFVRINLELNKGKVTAEAMQEPTSKEVTLYLATLRNCLDDFLLASQGLHHKINVITSPHGAFFSVATERTGEAILPTVTDDTKAGTALKNIRDRLRQKHSQWVYFDRSLKRYERGVFYQFKLMHRIYWSRRQAILDADEIIAETLDQGGNS